MKHKGLNVCHSQLTCKYNQEFTYKSLYTKHSSIIEWNKALICPNEIHYCFELTVPKYFLMYTQYIYQPEDASDFP